MDNPIGFLEGECGHAAAPGKRGADFQRRARSTLTQNQSAPQLHQLLDALPAAIYTTDAEGRITYYNDASAELWGQRPALGSSEWCGSWKLLRPDGTPMAHDECPMAVALKEKRPVRGLEAIAERPDGTQVPFLACPTPLFDEAGRLTGAVNMLVDISERKNGEDQQSLLIRELHHRVKNTLATVQAIMSSTASTAETIEGLQDVADRAHRLAGQDTSTARRRHPAGVLCRSVAQGGRGLR